MKECCKKYMMEQFGGDEDVIGEIYAEYVRMLDRKLSETRKALEDSKWEELDKAAHAIKGCALSVGDVECANIAIELRQASKLHEREEAERLCSELEAGRAAL